MFTLTYAGAELRRRRGRTITTALGLAAGVGLVIGIAALTRGLDDAQERVLAPLGQVGTDILVTRVVGAASSASPAPSATAGPQRGGPLGGGGGGFFGGGAGGSNQQDTAALLAENDNVVTDLSKLGKPGAKFTHDFFLSATQLSFPQSALADVTGVDGVAEVTGGLTQLAMHQTGTVPEIVAEIQTGGERITTTSTPAPMTDAERQAVGECIQRQRGPDGTGGSQPSPGASPRPPPSGGPEGGRFGRFDQCLPERFRSFVASVVTPLRTLRQVVAPPSTDITSTSYTAAGVDPDSPDLGLVTTAQLVNGTWFAGVNDVLLAAAYATKQQLVVGSTLTINTVAYRVAGLVEPNVAGLTADVYFPLATLQKLAGKDQRVTQLLVKANSSSDVEPVAAAIRQKLPGAQVVTTKTLADQVTGSLSDAREAAHSAGGVLAALILAGAFAIAALLTTLNVGKRVREIGTLRALGWTRRRVVRQVLTETMAIGALGAVLGVGAGFAVAAAAEQFGPTLSATSVAVPNIGSSSLVGVFGTSVPSSTSETTEMRVTAPVGPAMLALGVGCALAGGLVAGAVGGWRASRLSPAEALRSLG